MRRRLATAVPAAMMAMLLVVATALAGHGHATGGGTFFYATFERLDFEAHDFGPQSLQRDRGTAHYRNITFGLDYTAKIVCAQVTEDRVRFGYVIPETPESVAIGRAGWHVVWEVKDGGSSGDGKDSAAYASAPPSSNASQLCDTFFVPVETNNVLNGNFTVHEANE